MLLLILYPLKNYKISPKNQKKKIEQALSKLESFYQERAFQLQRVASGYQLRTKKDFADWIQKKPSIKKQYLSKSVLETLAVITYKQPTTKQEINRLRKVNSSGSLQKLLELKLIKITGRANSLGKPLLYATSQKFLDLLGLKKMSDMPQIND